jgi:threonine dehydrogenase-like Zn-dependent dehydrogenase
MTQSDKQFWRGKFLIPPPPPAGAPGSDLDEFDVVVVGAGAGGYATAVLAHDAGCSVVLLEAAAEAVGTTYKSGGGAWLPNNPAMQALAIRDDRDSAVDIMACVTSPGSSTRDAPIGVSVRWL